MADVEYFQKKLFQSLNVPVSRLNSDQGFSLGRTSEITRDELKFQKFILRLRTKFANLFMKALQKQLILTGVIAEEDWEKIKNNIHFNFQEDNYFSELKSEEILRERINTLSMVDPYVGKYYSEEYIKKNILQLTDDEIDMMNVQMAEEAKVNAEKQAQLMAQQQQLNPQGAEQQGEAPQQAQPSASQEPQLSQ